MVESVRRWRRWVWVAFAAIQPMVGAHRLDEYLQATLVEIEPENIRLAINLTPGVEVAEKVLAELDRNRDGAISKKEAAAYSRLLKGQLELRLDGRKVRLKLTGSAIPALSELRAGEGVIQMEFDGRHRALAAGNHKVTFENRHLASLSVYLFNAARTKSDAIEITDQKRNDNQSSGEIDFKVSGRSGN